MKHSGTFGTILFLAVGCGGGKMPATAIADMTEAPIDMAPAVTAIPLEGCSPFYTAAVTLGGTQIVQLAIDTGSTTTVAAAVGCTSCKSDGAPDLYDPSKATNLSVSSKGVYDSGEISWMGSVFQDSVQVGTDPVSVPLNLAAIASEKNFFFDTCETDPPNISDGILGLGTDDLLAKGTSSYLDQRGTVGQSDLFAVRLCHRGGTLWMGGYDPSATTGPMRYTPITLRQGYNVTLAGFAVGETQIPLATQVAAVVDTGGPSIILPSAGFDAIVAAVVAQPAFSQNFGNASWFKTALPKTLPIAPSEFDNMLPPLTFQLGSDASLSVSLPASVSYLAWTLNSEGVYDYLPGIFTATAGFDMGNALMRANVVVFDRANRQLGIAPATSCP